MTPDGASAPVPVPVLTLARAHCDAAVSPEHDHKEFGAKRDDFYPTELKVTRRAGQVGG